MEFHIENRPIYHIEFGSRLEAVKVLNDPSLILRGLRELLNPNGMPDKIVQAIEAVANGNGEHATVKALPAGPIKRKVKRVAVVRKKGGPKPGVKQQCKYCPRKIAPWRMSTHVAASHAQAPASEKPGGADPGVAPTAKVPRVHFPETWPR